MFPPFHIFKVQSDGSLRWVEAAADEERAKALVASSPGEYVISNLTRREDRIFKLRTDGTLHLVEEAETLNDSRARVQSLAELWPGEYVIYDETTGERVSITARAS